MHRSSRADADRYRSRRGAITPAPTEKTTESATDESRAAIESGRSGRARGVH